MQAVTSATIDNNIIFDNGQTEIYVHSSYNVDIYDNSISDEYDGLGIDTPGSEYVDIYRNEMGLSIRLQASYSQIFENNFVDITGEEDIDDTAIVIISSSTPYLIILSLMLRLDYCSILVNMTII